MHCRDVELHDPDVGRGPECGLERGGRASLRHSRRPVIRALWYRDDPHRHRPVHDLWRPGAEALGGATAEVCRDGGVLTSHEDPRRYVMSRDSVRAKFPSH